MCESKKVSILIPVYNREEIISETIESALAQTYKNIEIIIVDNCSTDKTYEKCNEFEKKDCRINVYRNKENIGPVRNWLECLEYSTGEYIKILWSDDWIDEDFIEKSIKYLSDDEIGFVYSSVKMVEDGKEEIHYRLFEEDRVFPSKEFIQYSILKGDVPVSPGCAIFRKKDVVESLIVEIPNEDGLIFNRYGAGNDQLIFLLTAKKYSKVAFLASTYSYFRAHKNSFSYNNDLMLYYSWAQIFFLNNYNDREMKKKFKTKMIYRSIHDKKYKNITKAIKCRPSFLFIIKYLLM